MTKSKMELLKKELTNKNTWLAIVIEFGVIFLLFLAVCFFGTDVVTLGLLLIVFFLLASFIKEELDDRDSRK